MDWQPPVYAKGKELTIGLFQAGEFYVTRSTDAIAGRSDLKTGSPQRHGDNNQYQGKNQRTCNCHHA
jgi:hypothetical protein